jgi:hypothetical protein
MGFTLLPVRIIINDPADKGINVECGSGGIGRRVSLRSLWPNHGRVGSSPTFRTTGSFPKVAFLHKLDP